MNKPAAVTTFNIGHSPETVETVCEYIQLLQSYGFLDAVADATQWSPDMADELIRRLTILYGEKEDDNV